MVGDILGAELPTTSKRSKNFAMSVTKKAGAEYHRLPPSSMFLQKFDDFTSELKGAEGSVRAQNPKNKAPLAINKLPGKPRTKMQFYEIGNCPWQTAAPEAQSKLKNPVIYNGTLHPYCRVPDDKMIQWETTNRENVSILSHVDHFVAAGQRIFESIYDKVMRDEKLTPEMLWNLSRQGLCMMYSAGMGVQDLARNNIWQIGEQITTRRDVFLEKLKERGMPEANLEDLRFSSLNTPDLFDHRKLDRAIEKTSEAKNDQVHTKVLSEMSKMSSSRQESDKKSGGKKNNKFNKQSFRQYNDKQQDRRDQERNPKGHDGQKHEQNQSNYKGKQGGQSRGQGKGYRKQPFSKQNY